MAQRSNQFAVALSQHDHRRLKAAFDACNADSVETYDRSNLTRWLDGTIPGRREFIQCLADRLEDQSVFAEWQALQEAGTGSAYRSVISRFESLTEQERELAFPEIRRLYLSRYKSVRSRLTYRVDLYDRPDPDGDLFDLHVAISWIGRIPANANVAFVNEQRQLGDAFADPACIFRDVLNLDEDRLASLLPAAEDLTLSYTPLAGHDPLITSHTARDGGANRFEFGNAETEDAQIRLSLSYPYPRTPQQYPIRFGQYLVSGMAEILFALHSPSVSNPRGMVYLPPGQERNWAAKTLPRNELVIYLGIEGGLLSEGDGVVLSWT